MELSGLKNKQDNAFYADNKQPSKMNVVLSLLFLVGGFTAVVGWFQIVDVYQQYFFANGSIVLLYNTMRAVFLLYVMWVIYAAGTGIAALFISCESRNQYSMVEQLLLGFTVGLGALHLLMIVFGYFNLYYTAVMYVLCAGVLAFSTKHFIATRAKFIRSMQQWREQTSAKYVRWISITFGLLLLWLFMVKGLYPGGSGDYYTHYFYYFTNVIRNHGLAPNDVWYHYYYSKGAGLHFLGILLTDPLATSVVVYGCVAVGSLALYNLVARFSPHSLWPLFCVAVYLLTNLYSVSGEGLEFQKIHEQTSAMIMLGVWAICMYAMYPREWKVPAFLMLAATIIGTAIITQAVAVFFAFFFALQCVFGLFSKNYSKFWFYFWLGFIATVSVVGILLMNYLVTGLATDQALNVTWKFANIQKLNEWGVLPNVMMVAWIRDNYDLVAVPWTMMTVVTQTLLYMRAQQLQFLLLVAIAGLVLYGFYSLFCKISGRKQRPDTLQTSKLRRVLFTIVTISGLFIVLSALFGHSQAASFYRFSSFFVPLLSVLATLVLVYVLGSMRFVNTIMPVLILYALISGWTHWGSRVRRVTARAYHFATGQYPIDKAYRMQQSGLPFGAINPGAYAAFKHVPKGERVWSTNVDSYCMVPNCEIESTISYKMSSNLNEILSGTPEESKAILQKEGLNYFIVSADSVLLDLLPFSQLFDAENIAKHLGIKWTDGKTYLLTWRGQATKDLDHEFLALYKKLLKNAKHPWFRFREAVPAMNKTMQALAAQPGPMLPLEFPWRAEAPDKLKIKIHHAAYGRNCMIKLSAPYFNPISASNATTQVKHYCQEKSKCNFVINAKSFGDPVPECAKSFKVTYWCLPKKKMQKIVIASPSNGRKVNINCGVV